MKELLLKIGLASADLRLKKGKQLWREMEGFLPLATGNKEKDADRLELFFRMLRLEKPYARRCLKEWLETEIILIEFGFEPETTKNARTVYKEHLNFMEGVSWNS